MSGKQAAASARALRTRSPKRKLAIHLTDEAFQAVHELADAQGSSGAEVVRRALSFYVFVEQLRREGGAVLVTRDDGNTVERVHFF